MNIDYDKFVYGLASSKYKDSPLIGGAIGLAGEVMELAEDPFDIDEQGDVLWYLTFACRSVGITLAHLLRTTVFYSTEDGPENAYKELLMSTGKYVEHIKKHKFHEKPFDYMKATTQLHKVYIDFVQLLASTGNDFGKVMERNVKKLKDRYPAGQFDSLLAPEAI